MEATRRQLVAAQLVDGDVRPRRVVGRRGQVGQMRPLPRQVVMVQHGGTAGAGRRHDGRGRRVEGERAQVLDHDEVGPGQRPLDLGSTWSPGRLDGQPGHEHVHGSRPGHRDNVEAEESQGSAPFGRLDRHAVTPTEAEGDQAGGGHGRTVGRGAGEAAAACGSD